MRKLQNLRQPTIKGNEWQRTNAERQKLVKRNSKGVRTDKSEKYQITHFYNYLKRTACTFSSLAKDDVMQ